MYFQVDTSSKLEWLKSVKKAHGSVEVSSIAQAEAINENGVYHVGNVKKATLLKNPVSQWLNIQWNLSNLTHQGTTRKMCQVVQDIGILGFYFSQQKYFGTINFCRMSQDVRKLRCRIAQVPLY